MLDATPEPKRLYDADAVDAYIDQLHNTLGKLRERVAELECLPATPAFEPSPQVPSEPTISVSAFVPPSTARRPPAHAAPAQAESDPFVADLRDALRAGTPDAFATVRRRWLASPGIG